MSQGFEFSLHMIGPQAKCLTFACKVTTLNVNLRVLAGKLHNVTFGVITRNITRWLFLLVSHWFIMVFNEPGFLLIRRSLVRAQVEEPSKKAVSKAVLFPLKRDYLSCWGPLGDFLPSNFVKLLLVYYTVDGVSKEALSQPEHHSCYIISSCICSLPCRKVTPHSSCNFFSTTSAIGFENFL